MAPTTSRIRIAGVLLAGVLLATRLLADPPAAAKPKGDLLDTSRWATDRIELSDGKKLEGMIESEDSKGIVFVEIHRDPGKPMGGVVRQLNRDWIASVRRLEGADRDLLRQRIDAFRQRLAIEAARTENVTLHTNARGGVEYRDYDGPWFSLSSTAEDETTRRSIVRVEQLFGAYRAILPPRQAARSKLTVLLFGSMDQYAGFCKSSGLNLENPSFYVVDRNLIAAGSELSKYAKKLANARSKFASVRREYQQFDAQMPALLAQLSADLSQQGVASDERVNILNATRRRWADESAGAEKQIVRAERESEAAFNTVTQVMFRRLAHETFHAYLENYVYPADRHDVPRWLNEGLAQVFEHGQLEVDTLRLDAPAAEPLAGLQTELKSGNALSLMELLSADQSAFLVGHPGSSGASQRHYLYSWGLAYYLAFQRPSLQAARLDEFVDPKQKSLGPIKRFEILVGMPLGQFEPRWREEMLQLTPRSRPKVGGAPDESPEPAGAPFDN